MKMMAITAADFRRATLKSKLSERKLEIGHALLVDGVSPAELCDRFGLFPSQVSQIKQSILDRHYAIEENLLRQGWIKKKVIAPKDLLEKFSDKIKILSR